jgi:hypothetical protein
MINSRLVEGVNYKIHDNFLPEEEFLALQNVMLSEYFPWYYTDTILKEYYPGDSTSFDYNFLFSHVFYFNGNTSSSHMSALAPLINKINPFSLLRIKANLYPRTDEIVQHGWHIDFQNVKFRTAVFYLNTNNGKTIFKEGLEVESVENRLVEFDTDLYHCSTSCTDAKIRANINLNYIRFPDKL